MFPFDTFGHASRQECKRVRFMAAVAIGERIDALLNRLSAYPSIHLLARAQLVEWPDHVKVLEKSLSDADPAFLARTDALAGLVWSW